MPVAGRKPNPDGQKRHRVKPAHDWTEVPDVPFEDGPSLPQRQPSEQLWPKATRAWWKVISKMPHCILWTESDWRFALDTAVLVAAYHDGELKHANEIRQREKIMGVTADARRDLRIRYVSAGDDKEQPAGITAINEYKRRLT